MIKIGNIELSPDTYWVDEFEYNKFKSTAKYAVDGSLLVQASAKKSRPMTLQGGWVDKPVVDALFQMLENFDGTEFDIVFEGRSFSGIFRTWEEMPIEVEPVLERPEYSNDDKFDVTVKLEIVGGTDFSFSYASQNSANVYTNCVCGMSMHGHRAVCVRSDGKIYEPDINSESDMRNIIGVSLQTGDVDTSIKVQIAGEVKLAGWGLQAGEQYVNDGGVISNTIPAPFIRKIGVASGSDTLLIQNSILIKED